MQPMLVDYFSVFSHTLKFSIIMSHHMLQSIFCFTEVKLWGRTWTICCMSVLTSLFIAWYTKTLLWHNAIWLFDSCLHAAWLVFMELVGIPDQTVVLWQGAGGNCPSTFVSENFPLAKYCFRKMFIHKYYIWGHKSPILGEFGCKFEILCTHISPVGNLPFGRLSSS